jgi:hypothetical protein
MLIALTLLKPSTSRRAVQFTFTLLFALAHCFAATPRALMSTRMIRSNVGSSNMALSVSQNIFQFFWGHDVPWVIETGDIESLDKGAHLYLLLWQVFFFVIKFTHSLSLKTGINVDNVIIVSSTLQKSQLVFSTMTVSDICSSYAYIL